MSKGIPLSDEELREADRAIESMEDLEDESN